MTRTVDASDAQIHARRWKTLAVLSLSLLIIGLDNTILNVALPSLQKEFDASTSTLQWMVDSYLLVFAGLLLTAGTLGDRFGRKLALQTGLVLFGGGSLAVLAVDSADQLIAVRAVMGLGAALIMPATLSIISNVFPRRERAKAFGIWAAMASLGVGLGPFAGGLLLEYFDWSAVFLLNVPVALAALAFGFTYVPESRDPRPGAFDLPGAALSVAALTALVYGVIEAPERGWSDPRILACFAAAVALGAAFVRWELRTAEPMLNLELFRRPRFSVASGAMSVAFFSLFGATFAMTQFLQDVQGYSALEAGAGQIPLAFGLLAGAGSSVKLTERFGTTRVVTAGMVMLGVLLGSALLWHAGMPYLPIGAWFFALALSLGWIAGPATDSVMGAVPEEKSGVASAMNDVTRQVGGALGTAVIGSLITSLYTSNVQAGATASDAFTDALGIGFAIAGAVAVLGAVAVKRRLPARHAETVPTLVAVPA
ncbi:MAG TPA: MFS transporter [Solirubrobacteraceae bacterium]|nr:MFS transporter [Solirubrobacteraceae bacterium]